MAEKIGAGDEPQTYDTKNGRYGSKGYDSRNDESIKRAQEKISFNKYNNQFQSAVFEKISTVRKRLEKRGYAIIDINYGGRSYVVKLYSSERDYEYDILGESNEQD